MNLSNLLGFQNQNTTITPSGSVNVTGTASRDSNQADISNLQAGQTIQGEVVMVKGNDIVISLDNGSMLNARLEKDLQISEGQIMSFEVKSNSGLKLALSPLFENMGQDPNVLKALTAAGLPATAQNQNMVSSLMQEGMPVDKNSLQAFQRQMAVNPGTDPGTLAQMNRLQIPVTPENIVQFEAYKNYEHQISQSVLEITDGLIDTFAGMIQSEDMEGAVTLYKEVLSLFTEEGIAKPEQQPAPVKDSVQGFIEGETAVNSSDTADAALSGQITSDSKSVVVQTDLSGILMEGMQDGETTALEDIMPEDMLLQEDTGKLTDDMDPASREQLANALKEAGFPEQMTAKVLTGDITQTALLKEIARLLSEQPQGFEHRKLADLFGSKEYNTLLKNEVSRQWLLKPGEVSGDRQVEELYKRLNEQTSRLTNALSQAAKADTPLANTVNRLSSNINFVNQLNQMFTYIQLPLKMNGENTHGELYIYTNKKNLAKKDGNVSALLHLDMEHLGPVDVYVAMQNQKVSTKFYLQDDSTIDLIADNIHILNERLEKKGYTMNCEFIQKNDVKKPMEEMLDSNKNISILASYSFDARA